MGVSMRFACSCCRKSMSAHSLSGGRGPSSTTALLTRVRESPGRASVVTMTDPCSSARYESWGPTTLLMICSGPHVAAAPARGTPVCSSLNLPPSLCHAVPCCALALVLVVVARYAIYCTCDKT